MVFPAPMIFPNRGKRDLPVEEGDAACGAVEEDALAVAEEGDGLVDADDGGDTIFPCGDGALGHHAADLYDWPPAVRKRGVQDGSVPGQKRMSPGGHPAH